MAFHPVVDGDVVPTVPIDAITAGAAAGVDVLVGTNTDDWRMFPVLGGFIDQVTDEMLTGPVTVHGSRSVAAFGLPAETALPAYRAAHPDGSPGDLLADVLTDWWVRIPAVRLAPILAAYLPGLSAHLHFRRPAGQKRFFWLHYRNCSRQYGVSHAGSLHRYSS